MARSLESIIITTKAIISQNLWNLDAQLPPIPWAQQVLEDFSKKPLVIGVMLDDGIVRVHPPIARVFEELVARLRRAGHEIVDWDTSLNAEYIAMQVSRPLKALTRSLTAAGSVLYCGWR